MNDATKKALTENGVALIDTVLSRFGLGAAAQLMYSIRNTVTAIAEEAFQDKLDRFVKGVGNIEPAEAELFAEELGKDKERFFKKLILSLDRLDEEGKADLTAKLFRAAVSFLLDKDQFNRLLSVIEKTYYDDLTMFIKTNDARIIAQKGLFVIPEGEGHKYASLVAAGLMEEKTQSPAFLTPHKFDVTAF